MAITTKNAREAPGHSRDETVRPFELLSAAWSPSLMTAIPKPKPPEPGASTSRPFTSLCDCAASLKAAADVLCVVAAKIKQLWGDQWFFAFICGYPATG